MEKLQTLIALRGLKQVDLADLSGVPVWKINRCLKHPHLFRFKQHEKEMIAKALELPEDISLEYIFTEGVACWSRP